MNPKKNTPRRWPWALLALLIVALAVFLFFRMEGQPPTVTPAMDRTALGAEQTLEIAVADPKSGIRSVRITMAIEDREVAILERTFPSAGIWSGGAVRETTVAVPINPRELGIADGPAILRLEVRDYSLRGWGKGNVNLVETPVRVDTRPPAIEVLSRQHNVSQGGAGLVVYRLSEPCPASGVMVGDQFYPGAAGYFEDQTIHLAFFALTHEQGPGTSIHLSATDEAGNEGRAGIPHHINARRFKRDTLPISDGFLDQLMPAFFNQVDVPAGASNFDIFLEVNRKLRVDNNDAIRRIAGRSDNRIHWQGGFVQLPGAANRAGFADHRTYTYKGRVIDEQYHLGVDLASLAQAPVPAANAGRVAFADFLGIYGNTVIIDHGMGLFSLYAHLSHMAVAPEQMVGKGDVLGKTGQTGLAAGDHLHFSILVHHTFVNPLEWWDGQWVENNVAAKIAAVGKP